MCETWTPSSTFSWSCSRLDWIGQGVHEAFGKCLFRKNPLSSLPSLRRMAGTRLIVFPLVSVVLQKTSRDECLRYQKDTLVLSAWWTTFWYMAGRVRQAPPLRAAENPGCKDNTQRKQMHFCCFWSPIPRQNHKRGGVSSYSSKIKAIADFKELLNVTEGVRQFNGMVQQLGKFIPSLADKNKTPEKSS